MAREQFVGVDQDVYHFVKRLLRTDPDDRLNFFSVYTAIQRSNLPLKRKTKAVLERSIERVLDAVQPPDEVPDIAIPEEAMTEPVADPNIMNRIIVKTRRAHISKSQPESPDDAAAPSPDEADGAEKTPQKRARTKAGVDLARKKPKAAAVEPPAEPADRICKTSVRLDDLAGMDEVVKRVSKLLAWSLGNSKMMLQEGYFVQRGVLLHGPPGCGKTALCKALAAELELPFFEILGPSIVSNMSGESERMIREVFDEAKKSAPAIIFIDEIDSIGIKRDSAQSGMERRITTQILASMDSLDPALNDGRAVVVMATTNFPENVDPALRRGGRFGQEIAIPPPDEPARARILQSMTSKMNLDSSVDFGALGKLTPGFVGADLKELITQIGVFVNDQQSDMLVEQSAATEEETVLNKAASSDLRYSLTLLRLCARVVKEGRSLGELCPRPISMSDFQAVIPTIEPSLKRIGFTKVPKITWADAAFPAEVKNEMSAAIVDAIKYPEKYKELGLSLSSGILLWGPPGCGKTLLAQVVAHESGASLIFVKGSELLSKYVGDSEKAVESVFARARASRPCIIFFDEFDAIAARRSDLNDSTSRVINMFLTQLQGMQSREGIHCIATTNRPDIIDPALLRPGRFDTPVFLDLPNEAQRRDILRLELRHRAATVSPDELAGLAAASAGFSGADLVHVVLKARQAAAARPGLAVSAPLVRATLAGATPSVTKKDIRRYQVLQKSLADGLGLSAAASAAALAIDTGPKPEADDSGAGPADGANANANANANADTNGAGLVRCHPVGSVMLDTAMSDV